jgi:hypothetical protein
MAETLSKGQQIFVVAAFGLLSIAGVVYCSGALEDILPHILRWRKTPEHKRNMPCLRFQQFQSFYAVAPSKWKLGYRYVWYKAPEKEVYFYFTTYSEEFKYQRWHTDFERDKATRAALIELQKDMETFSKAMRTDIESYQQEAQGQTKQLILDVQKRSSNDFAGGDAWA